MAFLLLFSCLLAVYISIFFVDYMLKSCMVHPYISLLENAGVTIKPFYIGWETIRFNRPLRRLGLYRPELWRKWFQAGAVLSTMCLIPVMILLTIPIVNSLKETFFPTSLKSTSENFTPMALLIPGVNVPFTHLFYIMTASFLCAVVHELGHAVAAARERVTLVSCGFSFSIGAVACVNLATDQLLQSSFSQKMRIYSAGVWHNVISGLLGFLLLSTNTWIFSPVFLKDKGVSVVHVDQLSGAAQPGGFEKDDQITFIGDCKVNSPDDWKHCFEKMVVSPQQGFCTSKKFLDTKNSAALSTDIKDCCKEESQRLCFKSSNTEVNKLFCLPGRELAESASSCVVDQDCDSQLCVVPIFPENSTERFIKVVRRFKRPVFFIGTIRELYTCVTVTGWISRFPSLSAKLLVQYELFLRFIVVLSASFALINLVPCYGFDGQHLIAVLVHHFLSRLSYSKRVQIINAFNAFGTFILSYNFIRGILNYPVLLQNKYF